MDILFEIFYKIFWAVFVAVGFAVLFNTPRRALWAAGLLGAIGFGVRTVLNQYIIIDHIVISTLAGAATVGIMGIYFCHRVHTPPIVFTVPAVISMIPGRLGYEFIIGILKISMVNNGKGIPFDYFLSVINSGLKTGLILMALAMGIIFPILFFNTRTVKNKDLNKVINNKLIRRLKIVKGRHK